jgi:hypothetical protein
MLLDKNKHPDPATQPSGPEEDYITLEKFEKLLDKFQAATEERIRLLQAESVQRTDFTSYKEFAKTFYETRDNAMATQLKCSNMFVQYRAIDEVKDMLRELRQELKQLPQKVN